MKGDFSRLLINPDNGVIRVLMQQGRVMLDADHNEQTSIFLRTLWALARDLIGPYGGPEGDCGFEINGVTGTNPLDLTIGTGRYYVDGIMVETRDDKLSYQGQAHVKRGESDPELGDKGRYLAYLDVWERHVTHLETDAPIREVALGEVDTASRSQLVGQVRLTDEFMVPVEGEGEVDILDELDGDTVHTKWADWLRYRADNRGTMAAGTDPNRDTAACIVPPDARYRGLENQLYRVEIHTPSKDGVATFKFSRDNGAVIFPLRKSATGQTLYLEHLGRDPRFGVQVNDWVELVDDDYSLRNGADPLFQVMAVDPVERTVTLDRPPGEAGTGSHPVLRRWDHRAGTPAKGGLTIAPDGAAEVPQPGTDGAAWLTLEEGIRVKFDANGVYRTGDYWLIPARTATGNIEWPLDTHGDGRSLPPFGVEHHYAPLSLFKIAGGEVVEVKDCRKKFAALAVLSPP